MHIARSQAADVIVPARRQPIAHRQLPKLDLEIDALVFARAGRAFGPDKSIVVKALRPFCARKPSLAADKNPVRRIGEYVPSGKCRPLAVCFSSSARKASLST